MHFLLKIRDQDNLSGQCVIRLHTPQFKTDREEEVRPRKSSQAMVFSAPLECKLSPPDSWPVQSDAPIAAGSSTSDSATANTSGPKSAETTIIKQMSSPAETVSNQISEKSSFAATSVVPVQNVAGMRNRRGKSFLAGSVVKIVRELTRDGVPLLEANTKIPVRVKVLLELRLD